MNLAQMRSRVRSVMRDTAGTFITDTEIDEWINEAALDLAVRLKLLQDEATGTTTGSTIALPANFLSLMGLRLATKDVAFVDPETWWGWSNGGGSPPRTLGRIFEGNLELYPTPDTGKAYALRYVRTPLAITTSQDSELPESLHVKHVHYARAHAKLKDDRADEGDRYLALYEANLPAPSREKDRLFPTPGGFVPVAGPFDDEGVHI